MVTKGTGPCAKRSFRAALWAAAVWAGVAAAVMTSPDGLLRMFGTGQATAGGTVMSVGGFSLQGSMGSQGPATLQGGGFSLVSGAISSGRPAAATLGLAHAYPNPARLSRGQAITFTKLTPQARIRVYSISGELVRTLEKNDPNSERLEWDGTNSEGRRLASGLYFYVIESGGEVKRGKLAIIR